jgi:acetylornithine deacetylase/succinyl-diaminopimelate desuccinylase-like protein
MIELFNHQGEPRMTDKAFQYIDHNKNRFLEELKEFLRFPSVSKHSHRKKVMQDCAKWVKEHLAKIGLESKLIPTSGHPIVWARKKGKSSKRIIIYGHYDVQPEDPLDKWDSPPFDPQIRNGHIYARGANDDKGQIFTHIKAVESLLKTQGELPCEILFLIEGEEECGGKGLESYVKKEKKELSKAEAIALSDTGMYNEKIPALTYGLRGIAGMELIVRGPNRDLHSGSFGGAVANPVMALSHILSQCVGRDGKVLIPGFYDDVRPLEKWERENIKKLKFSEKEFCKKLHLKKPFGEKGFSTLERIWARPTFEINGIYGGYSGEGWKTIIPSYAGAKITIRLVPNQDGKKIGKLVSRHLQSIIPDTVRVEFKEPHGSNAVLFDIHHPMMQAGRDALKIGFGKEPVYIREGGSIPVVKTFWEELKIPIVMLGFGLDTDALHSPNERFAIDRFIKGAKSSASFLLRIG